MQVQIRTDKHIEGGEALADHVRTVVEKTLYHYAERVSRVEVHLSDLNADKSGTHDHNCTMEARPKGMDPVAASHRAGNVHQAVDGAAKSLANLLRSRFGKLDDRQGAPKLPFKEGEV
ncbi:MAG: HPF/RaiA family ribosome-associated protein [Flavobacteriales bacterium]